MSKTTIYFEVKSRDIQMSWGSAFRQTTLIILVLLEEIMVEVDGIFTCHVLCILHNDFPWGGFLDEVVLVPREVTASRRISNAGSRLQCRGME